MGKSKNKGSYDLKKDSDKSGFDLLSWIKDNKIISITIGACVIIAIIALICYKWEVIQFGGSGTSPDPIPVDTTQIDTLKKEPVVAKVDTIATPEEPTVGNGKVSDDTSVESAIEEPQKQTEEIVAPPVSQSGDVTVDAKKTIRGDFGNGAERRKHLGANYDKVQEVVNKMYREGNLHW